MLVGDADHLRDDDAREDRGELVLELALAPLGDLVDQPACAAARTLASTSATRFGREGP